MTPPRAAVYIGLMSGTSLDGISAAAARFVPRADAAAGLEAQLLAFVQRPYAPAQRERLERALAGTTPEEYALLNFELGAWLADAAVAVIAEAGVPRDEIRAIGSHGQTIWHAPPRATWQMGESAVIAERTGVDVVADLRVRDMAAGGEGAPLVPIADALLFAGAEWRALQNIGGIGNVSVVPPAGPEALSGVRAFDTGPGVAIVDAVARAVDPSAPFDVDGRLAASGTPVTEVLDELLTDAYFAQEPPKSTGREHFNRAYADRLMTRCRAARADATAADLVATATALTARSIVDAYRRFLPEPVTEVLLSGGGARNPALVKMIAEGLTGLRVRRFGEVYFDGDAKEAVAFALLAHQHVEGRPGNVPRATGARGPRVLGKLTPGDRPHA